MEKRKGLGNIKRLFRKKKYQEVIDIMEPEIFRFRESFQFYSILGLSCLFLEDGGGAYSYLSRARQIKEDDVTTLLGIAAIHLKKHNFDEALKLWLRVLELDHKNKTAKRGLERVRRGMSEEEVATLSESGKIRMFYPPEPFRLPRAIPLAAGISALVVLSGFLIISQGPGLLNLLQPQAKEFPPRKDIDAVQLSRETIRTDYNVQARFIFNDKEVDETWSKAKEYFTAYRDNLATIELNRLLNSNAAANIKESARRLKSYAKTPGFKDFINFQDNFPFQTVKSSPYLYDGCFVLWRGTIANLAINPSAITFQFLIGSYDNRVFEGDVPVSFDFADKLENNYYIELLGKVVAQGDGFSLKGVLSRRIIPETSGR